MRLSADGHVYLESEISADLSCSMQYKNFPDVQVKKLHKTGEYAKFLSI